MPLNVGIVLLTYNGEKYLRDSLRSVAAQSIQPAKILAIDSGSSDNTASILNDYGVEIRTISKREFSHPGTRNVAATLLSTEFIVFLTQDATPAEPQWLEKLVEPFSYSPDVAAVYSRQIPRPDCEPLEKNDIRSSFGSVGQIRLNNLKNIRNKEFWQMIHFSNVSSAYRRNILQQNQFDETLEMAEDQEWAKRILERGLCIVYQPNSIVFHSHSFSWKEQYDRSYRMGVSFSKFLSRQMGKRRLPLIAWAYHVISDVGYAFENPDSRSLAALFQSPFKRGIIHYAFHSGWNREWSEQRRKTTALLVPKSGKIENF